MESAKEKAIREAWEQIGLGHLYEKTNEDGWLNCVEGQYNNYDKLDRMRFNSQRHSVRPESLHGISSNNGWIRIESEADLPTEDIEYWCVERESNRIESVRMLNHNKSFNILYYSHYQPIIKPQSPIY